MIAAVFIDGASASGGIGTVIGAVIGALVMGVMNNGMSDCGHWQRLAAGDKSPGVSAGCVWFDGGNKNKV